MEREEAIEVVKKNWPDSRYTLLREALETLIPELRESEDERIRKEIISIVKAYRENCIDEGTHRFDDCLSWLEKQKEQEHICDSAQYEEGFKTGLEIGLKKQKEQKQEWSEEDVDMLNSCISSIEEAKENRYAYKETDGDTSYDHEIAWLKSLRPSWKPSEQEKGALRTAIHILTDERSFPKAAGHLQAILDAFDGKESRKEWKPSEEQMDALNALNCHGDLSYVGQQNQLISLYNDLKKLM